MNTNSTTNAGPQGLMRLVIPHKGKTIFSGLFAVVGQGCGIVPFVLIYYIVVEVAGKPIGQIEHGFVWRLVFAGLLAVFLKYLFVGLSTLLAHISAYDILYDLRIAISKKLATLPLGYFNANTSGKIKKVVLEDVEQMEIFIAHNLPEFIGSLVNVIMATTVLFVFDWRLTLVTLAVLPVGILAQMLPLKKNQPLREKYYTANENTNAAMVQYIQGMPIIKAFNHTVESFRKYTASVRDCARYEDILCERWYFPMSIFQVSVTANMLVVLPVGSLMYLAGSINLATFVLFLLIGLGLGAPLFQFVTLGSFMEKHLEGMARINAILNAHSLPEPVGPPEKADQNSIIARGVTFAYEKSEVIKGIDFSLPVQSFTALVGPSGAGKTTLARLVLRFWDVGAGSIRLGETDIRHMNLENLMDRITFVFQDIFLFNDTIYENLRMGKPDATMAEIEAAARAAGCHDFITRLPKGYQSVVGERGTRISGGEKQRLSIARALLKNAPILVLDEATAFIDPENEVRIQGAINALVKDKTLIVIAHRLSTITDANQILVVDDGKIVARGRHETLLQDSTLYKNMWDAHISSLSWRLS